MLLREDDRGVLAIGQASHAWISGQLARAWGNDRFGTVDPNEEVCLAADQHDVGMAEWDLSPTRNPETGLPHSFIEMPLATHLELWRAGPRRLLSQSRYAALLVSMHGMRLYEKRDLSRLPERQADEVRAFLRDHREFQTLLQNSLQARPGAVKRNSDLIWTWDFLSLALCLDWAPCTARDVPTADAAVEVRLTPELQLEPWPFKYETVTVHGDGRRLSGRYESDKDLAEALDRAPWEAIAFELRSA